MAADSAASTAFGVTTAPPAARSVAGNGVSFGCVAQLTPMPIATENTRLAFAFDQNAGKFFAAPSKRSFGHFTFSSGPSCGA